MSTTETLVLGDACDLTVYCVQADGVTPEDMSTAESVKVALNRVDRSATLIGPIDAEDDYEGIDNDADWDGGQVVVPLDPLDTVGLKVPKLDVEVQAVFDGVPRTYFGTGFITCRRGLIPTPEAP